MKLSPPFFPSPPLTQCAKTCADAGMQGPSWDLWVKGAIKEAQKEDEGQEAVGGALTESGDGEGEGEAGGEGDVGEGEGQGQASGVMPGSDDGHDEGQAGSTGQEGGGGGTTSGWCGDRE
mgnify:CR=1 FL=1